LIELNCGAVLGKKRALLLEGIDLFRSIGGAAKAAAIPLDHALELVSSMNDSCRNPLVEILNAEVADISAWLTVAGERAVQDFKHLYKDLKFSVAGELRLRRSAQMRESEIRIVHKSLRRARELYVQGCREPIRRAYFCKVQEA